MFPLPLDFHLFSMQRESVKNQGVVYGVTLLELNEGRSLVLLDRQSLDVPRVLEYLRQRVFVNLPVKISNVDAVWLIFSVTGL